MSKIVVNVIVLLSAVNFQMQAISVRLLGIQTQRAVSSPAGSRYHWSDRCSDSGPILFLFLHIQSTQSSHSLHKGYDILSRMRIAPKSKKKTAAVHLKYWPCSKVFFAILFCLITQLVLNYYFVGARGEFISFVSYILIAVPAVFKCENCI